MFVSFLTHDASIFGANSLVSSQLNFFNSFFISLSKFSLYKSQCIQNNMARIV